MKPTRWNVVVVLLVLGAMATHTRASPRAEPPGSPEEECARLVTDLGIELRPGERDASAAIIEPCDTCRYVDLREQAVHLRTSEGIGPASSLDKGDFDGDGVEDLVFGDPNARRAYVFYGPLVAPRNLADADAVLVGGPRDCRLGLSVASAGDTNGDGLGDILVGAPSATADGIDDGGRAFLFQGPVRGTRSVESADAIFLGQGHFERLGESVAGAGDLNGDGLADIILGATGSSTLAKYAGGAYVFLAPFSGRHPVSGAAAHLQGESPRERAGHSVAGAGDVNGDGLDDIIVGSWQRGAGGATSGAAFLFYSPVSSKPLSQADVRILGTERGERFGQAVRGVGDLDGDGRGEIAVSSRRTRGGHVHLFKGPLPAGEHPWSALGFLEVQGIPGSQHFAGTVLRPAVDVDGDGVLDLVIGAHRTAHVLLGPFEAGTRKSTDAAWSLSAGFPAASTQIRGLVVGDFDRDGALDLVAGTPFRHGGRVVTLVSGLKAQGRRGPEPRPPVAGTRLAMTCPEGSKLQGRWTPTEDAETYHCAPGRTAGPHVELHRSGGLREAGRRLDSREDGRWCRWDDTGELLETGLYRAGRKQGVWMERDAAGTLVSRHYVNGEPSGE